MTVKMKFESRICINCDKAIYEYNVDEFEGRIVDAETKELLGTFPCKQASCPHCGQPLYVEKLERENKKRESECLAKGLGTLSWKEICALPRRYNISRENFETVLGITEFHKNPSGEVDKWNVWEGDMPNATEHLALQKVQKDPNYYIELLEAKKDSLPKEVYERSLKRAKSLAEKK